LVDGGRIMRVFNDASHSETSAHPDEDGTVVALIRHGETLANLAGRWHGITDGPLSERGMAQAAALAASYDGVSHVYSSHLSRARETAAALATAVGTTVEVRPDLHEIDFGGWEDHTPEEIQTLHPDDWRAVYEDHHDLPRGGTGETAAAAGARMARAVAEIAGAHAGGRVAAVTHGGSIRAYAADVVGLGFDNRSHLALPGNTEVSHFRMTGSGPVLSSYNMRPGS
jgi:broad specificity phosphatase PhoE